MRVHAAAAGQTGCCDDASEPYKLDGAFTVEAWVNYRGIGDQSATGHIMGNLHYNWGPDSGLCTATSNSGCSAGSSQLQPLRGCSAVCTGATSGGVFPVVWASKNACTSAATGLHYAAVTVRKNECVSSVNFCSERNWCLMGTCSVTQTLLISVISLISSMISGI